MAIAAVLKTTTGHKAAVRLMVMLALLVMGMGFALRLYKLSSQSLWTDEVYSIEAARTPLNRIMAASATPNNTLPTYFLMLREVIGTTNQDIEVRARLISVVAGTLTIPLLMGVVYLWRRREDVAVAAGVLLAVNPLHIWYSQETRAYGPMVLVGLLSVLFFELARERKGAGWWVGYFICSTVAISMHKAAIVFPASCFLWHGWDLLKAGGARSRMAILAIHVLILALGVTVLSPKASISPEGRRRFTGMELPYTLMTYAGGYSFGPSLTEIQSHGPLRALSSNRVEVASLGAVLLLLALGYAQDVKGLMSSKAALLLLVIVGMVTGYSLLKDYPYNVRYTLPALIGFVALAAELAARARGSYLVRVALAGAVIVSLVADYQWYSKPIYRKEDSRAVAHWLIDHANHVTSWTVLPRFTAEPILWYLNDFGHPEMAARMVRAKAGRTTSFPPVPDVFIIGRRDHIAQPDALAAAYKAAAGDSRDLVMITGFEIFERKSAQYPAPQ